MGAGSGTRRILLVPLPALFIFKACPPTHPVPAAGTSSTRRNAGTAGAVSPHSESGSSTAASGVEKLRNLEESAAEGMLPLCLQIFSHPPAAGAQHREILFLPRWLFLSRQRQRSRPAPGRRPCDKQCPPRPHPGSPCRWAPPAASGRTRRPPASIRRPARPQCSIRSPP